MRHGPGETLLTDGTASKVKAAALAAVPGGTVIRVETNSAGSPYEAHVQKSDGSIVTVKIDNSFNVTSTESGFGAGGPIVGERIQRLIASANSPRRGAPAERRAPRQPCVAGSR
jgi:hypothetical protein